MHAATTQVARTDFRIGGCLVDRATRTITREGAVTRVEPRAMDVLVALAERAGGTVSRDEIILAVWGHPHVSDESLSRCICIVRQALGDDRRIRRFVETVPKHGYRLVAEVSGLATVPALTRVAVLPFLNLTGDRANEHFADGLTELVTARLSSAAMLGVVSRTSCMSYKNSRLRLSQIARALGATHVVEGSVLACIGTGEAVMQLIDATSDTHVVSATYRRDAGSAQQFRNYAAAAIAETVCTAMTA